MTENQAPKRLPTPTTATRTRKRKRRKVKTLMLIWRIWMQPMTPRTKI
jgi:hypothetical protein